MLTKNIPYIIIQAGGKGTRLEHLTENKPKALVSIHGKPNIFHIMSKFKKAHCFIIGDYKKEVFKSYLQLFASQKYTFIEASGHGTASGIAQSLKLIPKHAPVLITWCDLYVRGAFLPEKLDLKCNYIGLSNNLFICRWRFRKGVLEEESSQRLGVAGVYLFKDKEEITSIPKSGEFCQYLRDKKIEMRPIQLKNVQEFGMINLYKKVIKRFANTRPFNQISLENKIVTKTAIDKQGKKLAILEGGWYEKIVNQNLAFVPKIYQINPLKMQYVEGVSLHKFKTDKSTKKKILLQITYNLKKLHTLYGTIPSITSNDHEALLGKTKTRLDSIASLIPDINRETFIINGVECINFYKNWNLVENLVSKHFGSCYTFIHGDPTFSNTMIDKNGKIFFIDPRGYFGKIKLFGDEDYDWAKLYYSLVGNYDQLNNKNFRISMNNGRIQLKIQSNRWEFLEMTFFSEICRSQEKIKIYHAIIWLSLTSYIWDDYDAVCASFYNGMRLMQEIYAKTT